MSQLPVPAVKPGASDRQQRGDQAARVQARQQAKTVRIGLFEPRGTDEDPTPRGSVTTPSPFEAMAGSLLESVDFSEPRSFDGQEKTEYDPLRDGPLRYLGYANELGEAFAAWLFAGGVPLSYAVAIGCVGGSGGGGSVC